MKPTVVLLTLLAVLCAARITIAVPGKVPDAKDAQIDFLADLPSLERVLMGMSETAFLDVLKSQKLTYDRQADDAIFYFVWVRKDVVVQATFREGRCIKVQRGNGTVRE